MVDPNIPLIVLRPCEDEGAICGDASGQIHFVPLVDILESPDHPRWSARLHVARSETAVYDLSNWCVGRRRKRDESRSDATHLALNRREVSGYQLTCGYFAPLGLWVVADSPKDTRQ